MSRFFSRFQIFLLLVLLAAAGCYPHGGQRSAGDDTRRLLEQARAACARRDLGAYEMLRERLFMADPQVVHGEEAQSLDAQCRAELQSAPRIGEPQPLPSINKRESPGDS